MPPKDEIDRLAGRLIGAFNAWRRDPDGYVAEEPSFFIDVDEVTTPSGPV